MKTPLLACCLLLAATPALPAEPESNAVWTAEFFTHYRVSANIVYKVTAQGEQKLDVYQRIDAPGPKPTLFYIHGGAWEHGSKEGELGYILPWLEMGWNVVTVDYRLTRDAPAPAAVEDCLCALHWLAANSPRYDFDPARIVSAGASAGGELALVVGMAPPSAGLDRDTSGAPLPRAAAIVSFSGVVDVADLLAGPHAQGFAAAWLGNQTDRAALARRVSPATYVRPGLPPILSVHGDRDLTVPYGETVKFHEALTKAGVSNRLLTITKGGHGGYSPREYLLINKVLREFLTEHHLPAE